ncbi:MAG: hypothetical protein JKX72_03245, partial [Robiginitomaculum sp.]|nr:hypothetical protein [Robiginitomaculum sp.]
MPSKKIIQIVPFRRTSPDGVGEYAVMLANALYKHDKTKTVFLSAAPMDEDGPCNDNWQTHYLSQHKASFLHAALETTYTKDTSIILHMSAYGYQKRGVPAWLIAGLKRFLKSHPSAKIISIFHELYAQSKPTKTTFWVGQLQKRIARQALGLSCVALTPCQSYKDELAFWAAGRIPIIALPVFSNVGEPNTIPSCKKNHLVIFGGGNSRKNLYSKYKIELTDITQQLGINEIIDIGSPNPNIPQKIGACSIRSTGIISAQKVSLELSASKYAALDYDAARLGKSTIYAAYAAHALEIICFD